MGKPFIKNVKVCPYCNCPDFVRFDHDKNPGFHPFSRFYCLKCKRAFWNPKDERQLTFREQGQKVYKKSFRYKKTH